VPHNANHGLKSQYWHQPMAFSINIVNISHIINIAPNYG